MSYILDALRRADAERERGGVPGLHAQPFPPTAADRASSSGSGGVPWRWIALGVAGGLALPLVWWLLSSGDDASTLPAQPPAPAAAAPTATAPPPVAMATAPTTATAPAAAEPAPPPTAAPAAPPPAAAPTPRAATQADPPAKTEPPIKTGRTVETQEPPARPATRARPAPPPASAPSTERPATRAAATTPAPTPTPPAPAAAEPARLPTLAELPESVRRQLPTLQIGGSMYSEAPANRMLIVNGQLLHEGSSVAPGLVLEQIRLKSAVFSFQGQRYEMRY